MTAPAKNDAPDSEVDLFEDRHGARYTTHTFAKDDDPWRGALILTPSLVEHLRSEGLLPLTRVIPPGSTTTEAEGDTP